MTESRRATWRKRFALSLLAAGATFVIVFEFLALQLQGAGTPISGPTGAKVTSVRTAGSASITSRASGSPATSTVSTAAPAGSRPVATRSRHSHSLTTRVSGAAMRNGGEADDL